MAKSTQEQFLGLISTSENMWHEYKGLNYASTNLHKKQHINKIKQLRSVALKHVTDLEKEIEFLEAFYLK